MSLGLLWQPRASALRPPTVPVRYADVGRGALANTVRPTTVIEFRAGSLPVELRVESEDFELVPRRPALAFVAKRRVFVRFEATASTPAPTASTLDRKWREPAASGSVLLHQNQAAPAGGRGRHAQL